NIAEVTTAVARGDLSRKITVDVKGEILELKNTINTMVDQLSAFAAEVTRVAREVGTEGRLGGQARVEGVSGTWRDLTDSVNFMAANLTSQVRNIAEVTTAVANGDLTRKITVDVRGEILELKNTINTMVDQLSAFAAEVTRVAREVGSEGKLGGQAQVAGVAGTWRGLTENVNQLAATLTTQLRAIADVSTAVTQGDLSRSIDVEAAGEVADLKDNINQMISNLRETTRVNAEQDWLKTNLARISGLMQGQRNLETVSRLLMSELTPLVAAQHGAFFLASDDPRDGRILQLIATYGYKARKSVSNRFKVGEALVGQAALENTPILITQAPEDYIKVSSGLGEAAPVNIIVLPVMFEDIVLGVIELASLHEFTDVHRTFLEQLVDTIGVVLNTIMANMRTEELLLQSQRLTEELQAQQEELQSQQDELRRSNAELESQAQTLKASEELLQTQQEELQQTNAELEEKAALLAEQNRAIEIKNREIELARRSLEEKAEQLAVSSRYKSEFLANMSHELRTPLNSLLILAKLLADNAQGNLDEKQVDFARTIFNAGNDLLSLINDILDLSKVEAGKMDVNPTVVEFSMMRAELEDAFRPVATDRGLDFEISLSDTLPVSILTDQQRLLQILRNLLSNAFKFTEEGSVSLRIGWAPDAVAYLNDSLARQQEVLAFSVADTGIGIPRDKLRVIFESFQQADGTTSRRFGGTGLGLSISREIARLLGGEIHVESAVGEGSVFTLYLPTVFTPAPEVAPGDVDLLFPRPALHEPSGAEPPTSSPPMPADDRDAVEKGDRTLLAIVSDEHAADLLREAAHDHRFKVMFALGGQQGVAMAHEERPTAIAIDIADPPTEALAILDNLKHQPDTRHIPVLVIGEEDQRRQALRSGAVAHLPAPASPDALTSALGDVARFVERPVRHMLVVEDDERQREAVTELIGGGDDVIITAVGSSEEALEALGEHHFDCVVLDLKLGKTTGFTLLETIKTNPDIADVPIIIYTGKQLTAREETRLRKYAETIIV
ncbi:MAG: ATP-binding protein, partial [Acidimicrobiia bacterium]